MPSPWVQRMLRDQDEQDYHVARCGRCDGFAATRRRLCQRSATTLLLVPHMTYPIGRFCWQHGRAMATELAAGLSPHTARACTWPEAHRRSEVTA